VDQNSAGRYPLISSPMQISTSVGVVQYIRISLGSISQQPKLRHVRSQAPGWHCKIRGGGPVVLGVPFGTGPAHVMEFGPVGIEQASGQIPTHTSLRSANMPGAMRWAAQFRVGFPMAPSGRLASATPFAPS